MNTNFLHLIDLNDYPVDWWEKIINLSQKIMANPKYFSHRCSGKIMGTLFYEPSTRTQMSFQTAMIRLGGSIIGFDNPSTSSVSKGENLKDTTKIVSNYADIVVMRHPLEGSVKAAALTCDCPVVNAGDGGHLHPTQTLTDLLTLTQEKGRADNLTIGVCGDLLNGRTVHSLLKALSCYKNNTFILISTKALRVPSYIKNIVIESGCKYEEYESLEQAIGKLDVLYMTRIQKERFASEDEYNSQKNVYILDKEKMNLAKKDLIVMHPLPRVDEITVEVDNDERALYFKQAKYGMFVRMALILTLLEEDTEKSQLLKGKSYDNLECKNPKCITHCEKYLVPSFIENNENYVCEYCDKRISK